MGDVEIHPTAIVDEHAELGVGVRIGPFCVVGEHAVLGDDVELLSHVVIAGRTSIGARTRVFPFASIGHQPQHLKFAGEPSTLVIGQDCLLREGVTINPGTAVGRMTTVLGDRCVLFANAHVAHDCEVGSDVILINNVMVAGHCTLGDFVMMGGGSAVHQFVRIGHHAFVAGCAGVADDVIPYGMVVGNRAALGGLNLVGLRRRGFASEAIHDLRRAYRLLFAAEGTLAERLEDVAAEFKDNLEVNEIVEFIRMGGDRNLCTPRPQN